MTLLLDRNTNTPIVAGTDKAFAVKTNGWSLRTTNLTQFAIICVQLCMICYRSEKVKSWSQQQILTVKTRRIFLRARFTNITHKLSRLTLNY